MQERCDLENCVYVDSDDVDRIHSAETQVEG